MRIGRLDKNRMAALLVWIYVIEATTFYIRSNFIDNIFQLGCIVVMIFLLIISGRMSKFTFDNFFLLYILLLMTGWIPDLLSGNGTVGLTVMGSYALPLFMYLYIKNKYYWSDTISISLFKIPVIYGVMISILGMIQEAGSLLELPFNIWLEDVEKTGNSNVAMCSLFGVPLGQYSSWGNFAGRTLLRIQGFYIEPSKMAMFLMIPIFFSWGLYKKTRKKFYKLALILCIVCFAFTMSRAGIVSIVSALVVKYFYVKKHKNKSNIALQKTTVTDLVKLIKIPFGIVTAAILVLMLMVQLSRIFPGLEFLYVGITDLTTGKANLVRAETVDASAIMNGLFSHPWGFGFSNNLHGSVTSVLDINLANAFILWLVTGGFLGAGIAVAIILSILLQFGIPCLKSNDPVKIGVGLAFICLTVHSLSYGTWMTPEFMIVVSIMTVISNKTLVLE